MHACQSDACKQGRERCPCEQACEWPGPEDAERWAVYAWDAARVLAAIFVLLLVCRFLLAVARAFN